MADQESQILPLAPQYKFRRSDEKFEPLKRETSRSSKCFIYFFSFIVFMGAIALTFSLIVFRIVAPNLELQSVIIKNLKFNSSSSSSPSSPSYLNMTFIAEIQVKNNNFGTFKFQNSSTSVFYNGTIIGTSGFLGGEVRGRETEIMNVTMKVSSNVWVNKTYLNTDPNSGLVKLRSYADFRGKVRVLKIAKQSKVSVLDCTMNLNLTSKAIQDLLCVES